MGKRWVFETTPGFQIESATDGNRNPTAEITFLAPTPDGRGGNRVMVSCLFFPDERKSLLALSDTSKPIRVSGEFKTCRVNILRQLVFVQCLLEK